MPLFEGVMGHGWKEWFLIFFSGVRRFFQATGSPALVVLWALRHAPRRQCLKSHTKQNQKNAFKRMLLGSSNVGAVLCQWAPAASFVHDAQQESARQYSNSGVPEEEARAEEKEAWEED